MSLTRSFGSRLALLASLLAVAAHAGAREGAAPPAAPRASATACPALLDHRLPRLQDEVPQDLCRFAGKVLLVVNTASQCGYTGQYEGLEKLHERYGARGLVVMGFPSNDFGGQEPGSNREIANFCFDTFGVKFPMFARSPVKGAGANPFFAALARESGSPPQWNFHKYLVSREGRVVAAFPSAVEPLDRRLLAGIERDLGR